ncbi:MAG TPA: gamma-glutamylcyclotransferase family protein [Chloroflexia bacterium]|nr:gamma-glutamylcyclotransferase family protein [Chloroflexia bacterium]
MTQPDKNAKLPFFVYGTLRTGQYNWEIYLKDRTSREIPARLPNHILYTTNIPYISELAEPDENSLVVGNLAFVPDEIYEEVLRNLDDLEEYDPESNSGHYLRVAREVEYLDEEGAPQRTLAWVYHGGPEALEHALNTMKEASRVWSGDWLKR